MQLDWQWAPFSRLDGPTVYAMLALREAVFVVEQACAYLDADGRDPPAWHLLGWRGPALVAYLRALPAGIAYPDAASIGRVVVAPAARGTGLGTPLMREGLARMASQFGPGPVRISAQAYLESWYRRLGFATTGPPYDEDGIPHVPMSAYLARGGDLVARDPDRGSR